MAKRLHSMRGMVPIHYAKGDYVYRVKKCLVCKQESKKENPVKFCKQFKEFLCSRPSCLQKLMKVEEKKLSTNVNKPKVILRKKAVN